MELKESRRDLRSSFEATGEGERTDFGGDGSMVDRSRTSPPRDDGDWKCLAGKCRSLLARVKSKRVAKTEMRSTCVDYYAHALMLLDNTESM